MIFVGDIALPFYKAIDFESVPREFLTKHWVGNLEGAIVNEDNNSLSGTYNHKKAIQQLIDNFQYSAFTLANNHIFDTSTIEITKSFLEESGVLFLGADSSLKEASNELVINYHGNEIVLINFGWEVIQCQIATNEKEGVNPLRKEHVINTVKSLKRKYPSGKIIPLMHWNYELEDTPQPFERKLAKKLIDLGVHCVIGCHAHRIGGIEFYKDRPIVYSLGNWLFKQNHFFEGNLKFPDFCDEQLAFEIDFLNDEFLFHFFKMDNEKNQLIHEETITDKESEKLKELTPFRGLSDEDYIKWYKRNHYHKNKGLPIYYWNDSPLLTQMKNGWVKLRDKMMKVMLNKGK